jgi:endothelin-converting enzyme
VSSTSYIREVASFFNLPIARLGADAFFPIDIDSLWDVYLEGDVKKDPALQLLWLSQPDQPLPDKSYYKDEDVLKLYEDVVKTSLAEIYRQIDNDAAFVAGLAGNLVEFEKKIANISLDKSV